MRIGVDYYPEHWPKERWPTDARLMREAGFNVVRLAEFAWVFMEPEEGRYDFSLFDEILEILARNEIAAILGTPTGSMPAWVARKYPECLAMKPDRQRKNWGVRKNNGFSSGTYRLLSERITRAMAEHFKTTPNVIGWQTDNEFDGNPCYCDSCRAHFQDWCRAKYGTLDALNRAWGTHFWGHRYGAWSEITLPDEQHSYNPGLWLDWKRFNSWVQVRFQNEQVRIIREVCPHHFVTHNTMSFHPSINYRDLCADLDFASWDNYPVFGPPQILYNSACAADLVRGFKQKNFWVMEQTAGPGGWGAFGRNPWPGEIRLIAYQQLAHGCDGMLWFRWRTCTAGREQYWHGLLGHDGVPLRRYREAAQTAQEFHKLWPEVEGTTVRAPVAILYDYDSIFAQESQPGFENNAYIQEHLRRYYDALFRAGVNVDIVAPPADLSRYALVIAPQLYVLPDATAHRLNEYVQNGGVLVADIRLGVKTETSLCHDRTLPGLLSDTLGIVIEEYESLTGIWGAKPSEYRVVGRQDLSGTFTAFGFADWITPRGAEVLAGYADRWHMEKFAAATRHRCGNGWGYYVGTILREPEFYDQLIGDALKKANVTGILRPPVGVEVSVREGGGKKLLFILNETEQEQTVRVPPDKLELLSGQRTGTSLALPRFDVAVVKLA